MLRNIPVVRQSSKDWQSIKEGRPGLCQKGDRVAIRGGNVLLVDDDETNLFLAIRVFRTCDVDGSLTVANSVEEEREMLRLYGNPDLIILDVRMPGGDGFDLLSFIRSDLELRLTRVVMLSSSQAERDIDQANSLGCTSYIYKPVDAGEYLEQLRLVYRYWSLWKSAASKSRARPTSVLYTLASGRGPGTCHPIVGSLRRDGHRAHESSPRSYCFRDF